MLVGRAYTITDQMSMKMSLSAQFWQCSNSTNNHKWSIISLNIRTTRSFKINQLLRHGISIMCKFKKNKNRQASVHMETLTQITNYLVTNKVSFRMQTNMLKLIRKWTTISQDKINSRLKKTSTITVLSGINWKQETAFRLTSVHMKILKRTKTKEAKLLNTRCK